VRVKSGLIGEEHRSPRSQIFINGIKGSLVERSKPIEHLEACWIQLHETVAIVRPRGGSVKGPIAGGQINVAVCVDARSAATLPDAALRSVGSDIVNRSLLNGRRVVRKQLAVVGPYVGVRREADVDDAVQKQEGLALQVLGGVENHMTLTVRAVARPGDDSSDYNGTA
jgi:hypothetical protein